jgi:hypothetical protein
MERSVNQILSQSRASYGERGEIEIPGHQIARAETSLRLRPLFSRWSRLAPRWAGEVYFFEMSQCAVAITSSTVCCFNDKHLSSRVLK